MIINHNLASLNTLNALSKNEKSTQSSLAKLSSGLRINSAADDAAGLAISEKMRGQIRGLDQAKSNSENGISLVQTAEGALSETTSILQRMRELAVQASSDTATDSDRSAMQKEVSQLKSEINRISSTTQFNTKNLLDGSLAADQIAQGTKMNSVATTIGATITGSAAVSNDAFSFDSDQTLKVKIGSTSTNLTISKGVYTESQLATAVQTAALAAGADSSTTVTFNASHKLVLHDATTGLASALTVLKGDGTGDLNDLINTGTGAADLVVATASTDVTATNADKYNAITITAGTNSDLTITTGTNAAVTINLRSGVYNGSQLAKEINYQINANTSLQGKATATWEASAARLAIASTDSSSITASGSVATATNTAASATDTTAALLTNLEDSDKNNLGLAVGDTITIGGDINGSAITAATYTVTETSTITDLKNAIANALKLDTSAVSVDTKTGKIQISGQDGTANALSNVKLTAADADKNAKTLFNNKFSSFTETQAAQDNHTDSSLTFQIGANQDQTMTVDINKMDVESLSLASIDISTQEGGENAITVVDNAINQVSAERAKLGAYENRLDHTINNLTTTSQNMTSAESRIRDVDMASEMANYQKNSVLQQAAQAMLAQANQQPQQVLKLLQ